MGAFESLPLCLQLITLLPRAPLSRSTEVVKQRILPTTQFYKIKSPATAAADLPCALKGIQGKEREDALCALGKQARQALS